jgi:glycogen debranching enzyme
MRIGTASLCLAALLPAFSFAIQGQTANQPPAPHFAPIGPVKFDDAGPVIRAHTETLKPFTVAGERGVLVGQQDGTFEAWVLPVKILSHLTIEAEIEGYSVPIDVNQESAEIEVRPDRTVITYSHIGFTVRQIMFSPERGPAGTGPVVLYEFDCLHPTDFTFRFTPNLEYMWPERNEGHPGPEWVAPGPNANEQVGGYYVLHADYPDLAAAITIPGARSGILAPYQERPQVHPVELKLHIDPARDRGRLYPLLMAVRTNKEAANTRALGETLERLNQGIAAEYAAHAESYRKLLANSVSIDTPDKRLNEAFQWAVVSIEQLKAKPFVADPAADPQATAETALVAGYYASGDSARPGFGWFFGRDALYTLYAVNGYGDFPLAKSELEFLMHRQRADGKIMHEYSQTASQIDWQQFPYMYAAADSTPLFLMAALDYVRASGDVQFLKEHRDAIGKAWSFETDPAHDTDHDGIYDNSQGTAWVESWPGGMPHQEIYLALLDQQASAAMGHLYQLLGDKANADKASARAQNLAAEIDKEYGNGEKGCYAFSRNSDGSVDGTTTVYPALAWWSDPTVFKPVFALDNLDQADHAAGSILAHGDQCLQQLAEHTLDTDWGLRDVSNQEKIYDGMSYHQGSVWPLFTGWAALAEFRGGQPLAGYQMLMQNANLTWAQDLGADTELLSGDFFVPFGRSTSHQLWSSAMVITPTLRGLFGISVDAQTKTITVNPHLPADWDHASVDHVALSNASTSLSFTRSGDILAVELFPDSKLRDWKIRSDIPGSKAGETENGMQAVRIPVPPVGMSQPFAPALPGARTSDVRVTSEKWEANRATLVFEGMAGAQTSFKIIRSHSLPRFKFDCPENKGLDPNDEKLLAAYVTQIDDGRHLKFPMGLFLHFPPGTGWRTITVTLTW